MNYRLIRSPRKTLSLAIGPDLMLTARAPLGMPVKDIEAFIREKSRWIERNMVRARQTVPPEPTEAERLALIRRAKRELPALVARWAPQVGVSPMPISVTGARTRYGSCSQTRLNFSWRLFLKPDEAIEYVVVHELCHILQRNHSPAFWRRLAALDPAWRASRDALRTAWRLVPRWVQEETG